MSKGWTAGKKLAAQGRDKSMFVQLREDGDRFVGAIIGEPECTRQHWEETTRSYLPCTMEETGACDLCEEGNRSEFRFQVKVWDTAAKRIRLLEGKVSLFEAIETAVKKYGTSQKVFEFLRKGKKGNPKSRFTCLFDRDLTSDETTAIAVAVAPPTDQEMKQEEIPF